MSGSSDISTTSVVYFILIYVFSNLAAFGVVSAVSAVTGKEASVIYKAFYKTNPVLFMDTDHCLVLTGRRATYGWFLW
jgi:NADH-quinone oxidoreductase subunit N